jgi:glyoxylase-like metal-dependent hydrolase (beta-lactamase superfamily II)
MEQLFEGVSLLEGEVGGRALQFVYLSGDSASLLMDTGCAHDPTKVIAPQITQAGGSVAHLTWILNTHPDLDHIGGNHEMKQLAPQAILACGDPDRHICQGLDGLMRYRYDVLRADHQIFFGADALAWLAAEGGEPQPIEVTFRGGEHIRLGQGWEVELIAVPGHAKGHLAVYDPLHQALYGGDAIHGRGYGGLDGTMKFGPTYEDVDDYLGTISLIEKLPLLMYVGCHWPVKRDGEVAAFCRESRDFVERADRVLLEQLRTPHSLRELCSALGPSLGDWPRANDIDLAAALAGHLRRLLHSGLVTQRVRSSEPRVLEYVRQ